MIKTESGDKAATCRVTVLTIPALVLMRSSRLIPGFRGMPAVMITISDPAEASYSLAPMRRESCFSMGAASAKSRALPWGTPSIMSIKTTSQSSFSANRCAAVAPTCPAPITVAFLSIRHSFHIDDKGFSWIASEDGPFFLCPDGH